MKTINIFSALVLVALLANISWVGAANAQGMRNVEMLSVSGGLEIETSQPNYHQNVSGFLAKPKGTGSYPGVVMIHEFWGLNDNIKNMAQELAKQGYAVLAIDLYNGQVAENQERARQLVSEVNQENANQNMASAVGFLRNQERVPKIASLGWCFGGGQSLKLALSGQKLDATVIYYGQLTSDENALRNITWPVLGIFGAKDQSISVESVRGFQNALNNLGISNEIHIYPDVAHAFANPSGMNYAPEETKDAWQKTLNFLGINLKR